MRRGYSLSPGSRIGNLNPVPGGTSENKGQHLMKAFPERLSAQPEFPVSRHEL